MKKLAVVSSHPIQYYAPLFKVLAKDIHLKVFYCHNPSPGEIGKDGFQSSFEWDVNLLDGYEYEFLKNYSQTPSVTNFNGCDTPQIGKRISNFGATHVVVFGWYLKSFIQILNYCIKNNISIAARGDSVLRKDMPLWKKIAKSLYYPFFLRKYDAFLYVGKKNKEYLKRYNIPERKLIFSPHAVDQSFWCKKYKKTDKNVFTFIWVGKFIDVKRPWDVLAAFVKEFGNNKKVKLKMIGTGSLFDELKVKYTNVANIHFLGFKNQTELVEEYNKSDFLVLTSYSETWGLVVNEAMACGVPAIVTDNCGCSEDLIDPGKTGFVYEMGNVDALSRLMSEAVNVDKDSLLQFINKKNKIYSYKRNVASFQEYMEEVLN